MVIEPNIPAGKVDAKAAHATARGPVRGEDIDNAISTSQLDAVIAARLNALGVASVLTHSPHSAGTLAAKWVGAWSAKVTAIVP